MEIYIYLFILFILSFKSTLNNNIINYLSFNIQSKEDFNKNFTFYLSLAKFTPDFPVYIAEFPHFPSKSELNQTEFSKRLYLQKQDDNIYDIYYCYSMQRIIYSYIFQK